MSKTEKVLSNLQIIYTWATVDGQSGRGMEPKCCLRVAEWVDEALEVLKKLEPQPPVITENAYGWKFHHCPCCRREFVKPVDYCDKCGQAVKWDD